MLGYFDASALLAFCAACVALALTPGPGLMFICATGAAGGPGAGVASALGTAVGAAIHVLLAALGIAALIAAHPAAFAALRWIGAAYLLWLAVQSWRARAARYDPAQGARAAWRAFRRGTITNVFNPKVTLFALAFLPQFADPARGPLWAQVLVLGALMVVIVGVFDAAVGLVSGYAGARLARRAERAGWINKAAAAVYGALAARLAIA